LALFQVHSRNISDMAGGIEYETLSRAQMPEKENPEGEET
jgi:hypothetical protein